MNSTITIGEKYGPAMNIKTQAEADAYFEFLVNHSMNLGKSRQEAESLERCNLGYFAGYWDEETQTRINRLFKTKHPVFGEAHPTPEEAFKMGERMAIKLTEQFPICRECGEAIEGTSYNFRCGPCAQALAREEMQDIGTHVQEGSNE